MFFSFKNVVGLPKTVSKKGNLNSPHTVMADKCWLNYSVNSSKKALVPGDRYNLAIKFLGAVWNSNCSCFETSAPWKKDAKSGYN